MTKMIELLKDLARAILHPFRGCVTWACQHGLLPQKVRDYLPYRWAFEPFTIYGDGWRCKWYPTQFDSVGHIIFWSGFHDWERETVPVMLSQIRESRCFLDIGANCGIYSVLGCTINPTVRVVAVEPVPKTYSALLNNVRQNHLESRVTAVNLALGQSDGVVSFHEAEDATMCSLATEGYQGQPGRIIQVNCRTLDSLVAELRIEPDFMKIDVEGFEHVVLGGAKQVLSKYRPRIVLEANVGDPNEAVSEILAGYGYRFQLLTDSGLKSRPAIVADPKFRNWLCTPAPY